MHPILGQLRRFVFYLLAWIPLAAILFYLLSSPGGLTWPRALAMVIPLCLLYASLCLSAWYSCRVTPLESSGFPRLVLTHLIAAVIMSLIWMAAAKGVALLFSTLEGFHGLDKQIDRDYPLLFASGVLLYLLAVALHYVLLAAEASHEAEQREMHARILARDSELKALKAQVNPHFLFNSLHSISALTATDPGRAREMCILLAEFLRATLGLGEKTAIPLRDELSLTRSFLSVEKVRFGVRLNLDERIEPEALDYMVPPLLLQPLLENAVTHGVSNLTEGGWIRLQISRGNGAGSLTIQVENNFDPEMPPRRRNGTGLKNVRQRLETRYGERATFASWVEGDRFRVAMEFPAERMAAPA
jgi:two-component system, LytTR family, sensor histidine kinase AlgZ